MGPEAVDQRPMKVAIVDYGMGNLSSVARAFEILNAQVVVTNDPQQLLQAERIVLPGVGAFGEGMKNLQNRGLIEPLRKRVILDRVPFLGICLGMQLLAEEGYEHGRYKGLGWVPAEVKPLRTNGSGLKNIHIGWNEAVPTRPSPFFAGLQRVPYFYFVHGYQLECRDSTVVCATSTYGSSFVSVLQKENIAGVQFHPEKSQEAGLSVLRNFLNWNPHSLENLSGVSLTGNEKKLSPVRLIPTLLYKNGRLTKTVQFKVASEGIRKDVGHPVKAPMVYDAQLTDELIFLDIHATVERRGTRELVRAVSDLSGQIFMPLTAGGGIQTLEDIRNLLAAGADKVAMNAAAVKNPDFIGEAARVFGNQCIVVSIDVKRKSRGYEVFTHSGTQATGLDPVDWACQVEQQGAGEILLTSIDRDGMMDGYDLELIRNVSSAVTIPVIASGGAGQFSDLIAAISEGKASAVAAASLFHFRDISPIKAKAFMKRAGMPVRD